MWNYVRLNSNQSPMASILGDCSNQRNLSIVIYHLGENHVECSTVRSRGEAEAFNLESKAVAEIARDAKNGPHAVLVYDNATSKVYLVDSAPELPVASALLLCVIAELLGGQVSLGRGVREEATFDCDCNRRKKEFSGVARRDSKGRFVPNDAPVDENSEPWKNPPVFEADAPVMYRRFRLGNH